MLGVLFQKQLKILVLVALWQFQSVCVGIGEHARFFFIRTSKFWQSLVVLTFLHIKSQLFLNCSCFHRVSYHRKHVGNPNRVLPALGTSYKVY